MEADRVWFATEESIVEAERVKMAKLVTVFGATGGQGNAVARALLASSFKVRAVTRNPASEKAQALKSLGTEVVKGDLNDAASVTAAVQGAYGVFYVTNYWELFGKDPSTAYDKEIAQVRNLICWFPAVHKLDSDTMLPLES